MLAVTLTVLLWNAAQYPWLQSYDAYASWQYTNVVTDEHRLPETSETDVWRNPPLFFVVAGQIQRVAKQAGFTTPEHAVQYFSALCVLGIVVLSGLLARALFPARPGRGSRRSCGSDHARPRSRGCAVSPGAARHSPDDGRALRGRQAFSARDELGWKTGLAAGFPCSRSPISPASGARHRGCGAHRALPAGVPPSRPARARHRGRRGRCRRRAHVTLSAYKAVEHGSPLAYSRPNPEQWRQHGRPAAFWIGLSVEDVFTRLYQPAFRNCPCRCCIPTGGVTTGARTACRPRSTSHPIACPRRTLALSSSRPGRDLITAVALGGLVALSIRAVRRRDVALGNAAALARPADGVLRGLPLGAIRSRMGTTSRPSTSWNAVPVVAVAAGYAIERIARSGPLLLTGVALATLAVALSSFAFLVLPHA